MQLPVDPLRDPITTAWFASLVLVAIVVVAIPLLRTVLAGGLWLASRLTGRHELRQAAVRVMPRTLHLIGSLLLGVTALAAPATATEAPPPLTRLDLDRAAAPTPVAVTAPAAAPEATPAQASESRGGADSTAAASATEPKFRHLDFDLDRGPLGASTRTTATPAAASEQVHLVQTGDTLWDIAESLLPEADDADLTAAWRAIWAANRSVIGDDPGHIHVGQRLDVGVIAR